MQYLNQQQWNEFGISVLFFIPKRFGKDTSWEDLSCSPFAPSSNCKGSSYTQRGSCYLMKDFIKGVIQEELLVGNHSVIFETGWALANNPNYWNHPTGQMKLLFERMRPFTTSEGIKGKTLSWFSCRSRSQSCRAQWSTCSAYPYDHLGMKYEAKILVAPYEKGGIATKKEMKKVYDLGLTLDPVVTRCFKIWSLKILFS